MSFRLFNSSTAGRLAPADGKSGTTKGASSDQTSGPGQSDEKDKANQMCRQVVDRILPTPRQETRKHA